MTKKYPRWKRFDLDAAEDRTPAQPSLQSLAYELAALIGETGQREFSASLDWTAKTHLLIQKYQDKINHAKLELRRDEIERVLRTDTLTRAQAHALTEELAAIYRELGLNRLDDWQDEAEARAADERDYQATIAGVMPALF